MPNNPPDEATCEVGIVGAEVPPGRVGTAAAASITSIFLDMSGAWVMPCMAAAAGRQAFRLNYQETKSLIFVICSATPSKHSSKHLFNNSMQATSAASATVDEDVAVDYRAAPQTK